MFSISTTSIDLDQTHSSLALHQLSEEDRKVVARLKQTYPSHILAAVFQDAEVSQDQAAWETYRSRESTASSTLCLSNVPSLDSDAYTSSTTTSRSNSVYLDSLFKKRSSSVSCGATQQRQRYRSRRSTASATQEPKELRITPKPPVSSGQPSEPLPAKPVPQPAKVRTLYFCTTCEESFQERDDWQQHEHDTHEQQYYWTCPNADCDYIFTREDLFTQHHQQVHGCENCVHACESQNPLPSKRSWGCGFDKCKGVFDSWEMRCGHVSSHFESLAQHDDTSSQPSQWRYTNMIRNLLRQADVKDAYKRVMTKCHGDDKVFWPKMKWEASSSEELKRRLEYRDFRSGVKNLARMACQLGHPISTDTVKITLEPADDSPVDSPSPDSPTLVDPSYLHHIDKFPQPGTNPFDLYGPVPPSPIIQLDFLADLEGPDPEVAHLHSTKNSISGAPYSLYPSPMISERDVSSLPPPPPPPAAPLPLPPSADAALLQTPELVHDLAVPSPSEHQLMAFPAVPTFTPVVAAAPRDAAAPRPKTPMAMIRSAKSLMRKRSAAHVGGVPIGQAQAFDPVLAAQAIQTYHAR